MHHKNEKALNLFAREVAPAATAMAPGNNINLFTYYNGCITFTL
jgi:hypothetical protein